MLTKDQADQIQDYLSDASYLTGGHATRVVFPESAAEVAEVLRQATETRTPVTVSGAGTGTVAGRVPFGGLVIATDRLDRIRSVEGAPNQLAVAEAGVRLSELQRAVDAEGLLYPPDPTERSCFVGGNIATNASGARTFKYGPTRNYVERLQVALAAGEVLDLRRGDLRAGAAGQITIPLPSGKVIEAQLPSYQMPNVRKHASGYFVAPEMDLVDLFIGSEGTLGVIVEADLKLLLKPEGLLSGVVFFDSEENLLGFVRAARTRSLANRGESSSISDGSPIDARALEYFDDQSLGFLRTKYDTSSPNSQKPERKMYGILVTA